MARFKTHVTGEVIEVPDGLTAGGRKDWAMHNYGLSPEDVGIQPHQPDPGNKFMQFEAGMGKFLADRGVHASGVDPSQPAPPGFMSGLGEAALPIAAGVGLSMVPGAQGLGAQTLVQGAGALAMDAMRSDSGLQSSLTEGGIAAGLTGATGMAGRIANTVGLTKRLQGAIAKPAEGLAQKVAQFSRGGGGLTFADKYHKGLITRQAAKVFGMGDDVTKYLKDVDEEFLTIARTNVNDTYKAAMPNQPVSVDDAWEALTELPKDAQSTRVGELIKSLTDSADGLPPERWRAVQRALREEHQALSQNLAWGHKAGHIEAAIDALDGAAMDAGGDKALLGVANQRFKFLATLEEINSVVEAGEIPAGELLRKLGRENYKGFGRRAIAEGAGEQVMPEIAELMTMAKDISSFNRATAGGSATAGRLAAFQEPVTAVQKAMKGELIDAAGSAVKGALALGGGRASIGQQGRVSRALAGAVGQSAAGSDDDTR